MNVKLIEKIDRQKLNKLKQFKCVEHKYFAMR